MSTTTRTHDVAVRGHVLSVTVHGDGGVPIVLLPGGAAACTGYFPDLVDALADRHTVVVHDRLGSGTAPLPAEPVSLRSWTEDLVTVLDDVGIDRALLVGHSLGGANAALALLDHPDRVAGALLLDPTPVNDARVCRMTRRGANALAWASHLPLLGGPIIRALTRSSLPKGLSPSAQQAMDVILVPGWVDDTARAVRELDADAAAVADRRSTSDAPVMVVTGDRKPGSAIRRAHEALAEQLGGTLEVWPDTGHSGYLQHPDRVVARVEELIARIDGQA